MTRLERLQASRLYLVVTPESLGTAWVSALERALASGCVGMVQLRSKEADDVTFLDWARRVRALLSGRPLLILNDRVHLVEAAGADGAHIGEYDVDPAAARSILGGDLLLGVSTHDADEVAALAGSPADHAGLGPCYASGTKALTREPGGPALVRNALPRAQGTPIFPIGGITPENAPALAAAGARRLAVGAGVLSHGDPGAAAKRCFDAVDDAAHGSVDTRSPGVAS